MFLSYLCFRLRLLSPSQVRFGLHFCAFHPVVDSFSVVALEHQPVTVTKGGRNVSSRSHPPLSTTSFCAILCSGLTDHLLACSIQAGKHLDAVADHTTHYRYLSETDDIIIIIIIVYRLLVVGGRGERPVSPPHD